MSVIANYIFNYIEEGRVFISLPKNDNAVKLVFRRDKEIVGDVEIGDLIKNIPREDPNGDKN